MKAVIIMGSKSDMDWSEQIAETLSELGIESVMRIASAHKVPSKAIDIIKEYEDEELVYITVAGRSNALSGFVDAQTEKPVIACPPYSSKFAGADIFSSLRMPSGVCPMVVMGTEQAALAAAKMLGLTDEELQERIKEYQEENRKQIHKDDKEVR
ncbi:MAG: 5-(carboxyamino)imidazole ribonucleotide mutase [Candidatus Thermoplasmatota archaeon]|nr:5-(carboxyamino)imidazole ribonucleotide mutase [Candidatus Thermoplasmatota archaeon]